MDIKRIIEEREEKTLSKYACKSKNSKGRIKEEEEQDGDYRTDFAHDRDRILHSNAFRREKNKTQVFILPDNDHIRSRLTHTLEVAQIGKTMAAALNLNETLTEAIALGHDTAHTCFGHAGERALDKISKENGLGGYKHAEQAYRRLITISGLNLTYEVMDGITKHSGISNKPDAYTLEGQLIPFADKIAYLTSDLENAISMGIINNVPEFVKETLGYTKSEIITTLVTSIIKESWDKDHICMEDKIYQHFKEFREFNFKNIYFSKLLNEQNKKCEMIIQYLYEHLLKFPDKIPERTSDNIIQCIIDYIAGMTDKFALSLFNDVTFTF